MQRSTSSKSLHGTLGKGSGSANSSRSDIVATSQSATQSLRNGSAASIATAAIGMSAESSGYYGHLDESQRQALEDMKVELRNKGFQIASLNDEAEGRRSNGVSELELLQVFARRFLRARRFDVAKALAMYSAAVEWRKSIDIDSLYMNYDWAKAQQAATIGYRQYFHREDKSGSPIHIHELQTIDLTRLFKVITPEDQVRYMFLLNESNFRLRFPGCTRRLRRKSRKQVVADSDAAIGSAALELQTEGNSIDQEARELGEVETVTGILDIRGVGLMSFWKVKDLLGQVIRISDNYYPETSNRLYIINAPSVFSTIWGYIKGWLDARTASRVFILGADYQNTLLEHIDAANLPSFLGGTCTCAGIDGGCRNGDIGCWNPTGAPFDPKHSPEQ